MTNLFVIHDDLDSELGSYFSECATDIINAAQSTSHFSSTLEINGSKCNVAFVDISIDNIKPDKFLFLAYSHGREKALTARGQAYVEIGGNCHKFENSFFYTNSCLSGVGLGLKLVEQNCKGFIGYNRKVYALLGSYQSLSINCDNFGIKKFFEGCTVKEAFDKMKENYTTEIDNLIGNGDFFRASHLRVNRDSLVLYGNHNLTIRDLYNIK